MYVQDITRLSLCDEGFGKRLAENILQAVRLMDSPLISLWIQHLMYCCGFIIVALGFHPCDYSSM